MKKIKSTMLLLVVLSITSCSTTKLEMDNSLEDGPKGALLTGLTINLNSGSGKQTSVIDVAEGLIADDELEAFGISVENSLKGFLSDKGFVQYKDAEIAQRVNLPSVNIPTIGYYVHPETSNYNSSHFTGIAIGFDSAEHISKVKGDSDTSYFIFSDVSVSKSNTFGIFGGYPTAVFKVAVVNELGDVVLEAKAVGMGEKSFIGVDLSNENMTVAMNNAITKLTEL